MEAILGIILFLFGGWILRAIIAGGKSAVTGQSFQESFLGEFHCNPQVFLLGSN